ncbi:BspA family leucine-rich repeat surface protein [Lactobacillus gallinarum]|uniref:BspA family leucine-rich repeat surface protein n=1 Tax=Lactobacillus gallinarum TaxID=52242 RepID=UPI0025A48401|nr:BspA family leucine-rich repeat surface protein [Lactobacillus gallinarum]MDM8281846.1 BspA family leucine-rich repeat surface protein [Lactobacillus gallinarum]
MHEQKNVYSLRKLSVGLASVIVGTCFFISNGQNVKADTVNAGEQLTSTVIQQDSGKKQEQDSNEQNDQTNVSNSKTGQQQSTNERNDVENVDSNLNDTDKLGSETKPVESEANQKFDQVKDQFKQETTKADIANSSVIEENDEGKTIQKADVSAKATTLNVAKTSKNPVNVKDITESKVVNKNLNGGFDEATWGTLDVNDWKGNVQGDYYQLTDYTGDANHVIVPNEADFEKAGISTSGKQVGVTSDLMHTIFRDKTTAQDATVAFSKTDNKMIKAINADWNDTWGHSYDSINGSWIRSKGELTKFDGINFDVSNVTNMSGMFSDNQIKDLSPLANWKVDQVTDMNNMFNINQISDLSPLSNWHVNSVTNMSNMFDMNKITDLSPLANWHVDNVTYMAYMFSGNQISDLSPLSNWHVNNVITMKSMFQHNQISDLRPLSNWHVDNVRTMSFMFETNKITDISPLANWNVNNVDTMMGMFNINISSIPTKTVQAKRIINFVYPDGYTGKKQDSVTQTVDVPTKQVKVELTTGGYSKPSNNILDWATKTETSEAPDLVYFQAYTVPTVANLVPSISTVSKTQADPNKPINVTVTYTAAPVTVHFVDTDENANKDSDAVKQELDKTVQLSGTYGSNVDFSGVKLPANFELANDLPSVQYVKTDSVTINLKHYINDVKTENAEDATRTIVIKKYNGNGNLTSTQTVVQQIAFYKHDYVDAVTNKVKSSKYIFDDKSSPALSHNLVDGKATNAPSYILQNGKYYFAKYKLDVPAGYKAKKHVDKINPNLLTISLFALPAISTDPTGNTTVDPNANKGSKTDDHKFDTSSSSVTDKANNSHDLHDNSKTQNDQPIVSNNETDHTINVSAQAVDPTVEPEDHNTVVSSNTSTTSAPTQQSSTNNAEQPENIPSDRVVNNQTNDDFADSSREENDNSKAPEKVSNWSKPKPGKITHVNLKASQNGLNEAVRGQSVATHPATSVINNSKSDAKQLPQTGENDSYQYSALGVLLGLNVAIAAVGAEKKRKKY